MLCFCFRFNCNHKDPIRFFFTEVRTSFCTSMLWLTCYSPGTILLNFVISLWTFYPASHKGVHYFRNWGVSTLLPASKNDASVSAETNPCCRVGRNSLTVTQTPGEDLSVAAGQAWRDTFCGQLREQTQGLLLARQENQRMPWLFPRTTGALAILMVSPKFS